MRDGWFQAKYERTNTVSGGDSHGGGNTGCWTVSAVVSEHSVYTGAESRGYFTSASGYNPGSGGSGSDNDSRADCEDNSTVGYGFTRC
jgi:hypothetical protein